jgi:hypothetical protein
VVITAPWSYEALDRACARLAEQIRGGLSAGTKAERLR